MKYYFKSFKISGAEHAGTHLDAPAHFSEGGLSTDEVWFNFFVCETKPK